MAVRTYAPKGATPVLNVPLTHDHLSAISAITPQGKLYLQVQEHAYCSTQVIEFLRLVLKRISGKLLLLWDGAPIHRSKEIKTFLRAGAAKRLHLERLPAYAPELNPDEGIWNYLKRVRMKNRCCRDLLQLREELTTATSFVQRHKQLVQACIRQCAYI